MCGIPGSTVRVSDGVNLSSPSDPASVEVRLIGYSTKTPRYNHSIRPRVGGCATLGCSSRLHRRRVGAGQGETRISSCSSPVCGPPTRGRWSREVREAQAGFVGLTLQCRRHSLSDAARFSRAAGFITRRVMSTLAAPNATNTQSNPISSQAADDNSWIVTRRAASWSCS